MAVAAVAAGIFAARQRQERVPAAGVPAGEVVPSVQSLDAIRAAGL